MWKMKKVSDTVHAMRISYVPNHDWKFKILVSSDRHIDSRWSNLSLQKKHLDKAVKYGWPIIDLGDITDAMQGRKDPRSSRLDMLAAIGEDDEYFDSVVDYTTKFLTPYAKHFALIGLGNHETSVIKHNGTNLVKRCVNNLNDLGGNVMHGAYAGWIKLYIEPENGFGTRHGINIRYFHGKGGSAPVTKGVINCSRRGIVYPDADLIISGHTHESFVFPITRSRISKQGTCFKDEQLHVQIPSYKDELIGKSSGFAVEKEFAPTPEGAYWIKFYYERSTDKIRYDAVRAL